MNPTTLKDFLATVIADHLSASQLVGVTYRGDELAAAKTGNPRPLPPQAERIADELVKEAFASNLPLSRYKVEKGRLGGGNTAEVVAQVTLHMPFAFKLDQAVKKLGEEGATMRDIKTNMKLSQKFRDAWPIIYAVRNEIPPYAYLMEFFPKEDGWRSLEDRLFPAGKGEHATQQEAIRWMHHILDILFTGYVDSVDARQRPSLLADYFDRIRERLEKTAKKDPRFASRTVMVNGQRMRPWKDYLAAIERNYAFLDKITPLFSTITHGDPNPGNLMLRTTTEVVELKLIDPKEWMTGDYLFDVAKITHFLSVTGPVEKPADMGEVKAKFELSNDEGILTYQYERPVWTELLIEACYERAGQFAASNKDSQWRARYELGMAANLLGLPLGRLEKQREQAALILFGEGLKWLDIFCSRLDAAGSKAISMARSSEMEPEALQKVRAWVREKTPGVHAGLDRRGFQLLHWEPVRPNDKNKPAELSLEHEARLMAVDARAIDGLLDALVRNEGLHAGDHLLKNLKKEQAAFADLIVRRYNRESGAQSRDWYYDVPMEKASNGLIPQMVTLRERRETSKFMTWSTTNKDIRPLNLELPFFALNNNGMTARLEFNWIDDLQAGLREAQAPDSDEQVRRRNPLYIAMQTWGLSFADVVPVLEHTTYRQKFGLKQPANGASAEKEVFVINIDTIVAQDLMTKRVGTYHDIDISGVAKVDAAELKQVSDFAETIALYYGLHPNPGTKAWRSAQATGDRSKP